MIRQASLSIRRIRLGHVKVPKDWYEVNKNGILTVNVMFVSGIPFFITYSKIVKLGTVELLPRQNAPKLAN